jgi:hypothetical protein
MVCQAFRVFFRRDALRLNGRWQQQQQKVEHAHILERCSIQRAQSCQVKDGEKKKKWHRKRKRKKNGEKEKT